jgi:hypothetical protein
MLTATILPPARYDLKTAAAYQVLALRTYPHECRTRQRENAIKDEFAALERWLSSQPIEISSAYRAAIAMILKETSTLVAQWEWAIEVQEELKTFPKPQ